MKNGKWIEVIKESPWLEEVLRYEIFTQLSSQNNLDEFEKDPTIFRLNPIKLENFRIEFQWIRVGQKIGDQNFLFENIKKLVKNQI